MNLKDKHIKDKEKQHDFIFMYLIFLKYGKRIFFFEDSTNQSANHYHCQQSQARVSKKS